MASDTHGPGHGHAQGGAASSTELLFVALAGVLLLAGWWIARLPAGSSDWSVGILIASYGFGGFFALREAIEALRDRRFEIDFLMLVAAAGAAVLGAWAEGRPDYSAEHQ